MKRTRLLSAIVASIAATGALIALAQAQPQLAPLEGQLQEKNSATARQLSQTWYENEGDWQGVWTPVHPSAADGAFTATWHLNRQVEHATLQMTMPSPLAVQIVRTHTDGRTCRYQGYLNTAGNVVTGTYTCSGSPRPMNFLA